MLNQTVEKGHFMVHKCTDQEMQLDFTTEPKLNSLTTIDSKTDIDSFSIETPLINQDRLSSGEPIHLRLRPRTPKEKLKGSKENGFSLKKKT